MGNIANYIGQKVNDFTVIRPTKQRKNGYIVWLCECNCEKEYLVSSQYLSAQIGCYCNICSPAQITHRGRKIINLTNIKFGKLTAIKQAGKTNYGHIQWLCKCDCGNEHTVASQSLRRGKSTQCPKCSSRSYKSPYAIGENKDNIVLEMAIKPYKRSARDRKLQFKLTNDQCKQFMLSNCHYCDSPPKIRRINKQHEIKINGIDRINSNNGYTIDNCVPCCSFCNFAKRHMPYDKFIEEILARAPKIIGKWG